MKGSSEEKFSDMGARLRQVREGLRLSQEAFSNSIGIPKISYGRYERGSRQLPLSLANEIAVRYNVRPSWLLTGEGEPQPKEETFVQVPCLEVQASAGDGQAVECEQISDSIRLSRSWLWHQLGVSPQNLNLIKVVGDSMEPTLIDGDIILVDCNDRDITHGRNRIFVLRVGDDLKVKRIERVSHTRVLVKSDNPKHPSEFVELDHFDQEFTLVGRVVSLFARRF